MRNIPALDGLRAVAILSVMSFHAGLPLAMGGSLGVDIFFVLSGWLITSILVAEMGRTATIDYPAFLLRRVRRLMPALVVLLAVYVFVAPLSPDMENRRWFDAATALFYLTNLRETFWPAETPLSHTWSLAAEAQFYLLWPFALRALLRFERRHAVLILYASWIALTAGRVLWQNVIGGPGAYYFLPLHSTGLLLGAALALNPTTVRRGGLALGFVMALIIGVDTHRWFLVAVPIAEIATAMVVADPPRFLEWKPLRFVGRISYGMYLWHIPLLWMMPPTNLVQITKLYLISSLLGWLSCVLVENKFSRSRNLAKVPLVAERHVAAESRMAGFSTSL